MLRFLDGALIVCMKGVFFSLKIFYIGKRSCCSKDYIMYRASAPLRGYLNKRAAHFRSKFFSSLTHVARARILKANFFRRGIHSIFLAVWRHYLNHGNGSF